MLDQLRIGDGLVEKSEGIAIDGDVALAPGGAVPADEVNGESVEEFVRKMDAAEGWHRGDGRVPRDFAGEVLELRGLPLLQDREGLDDAVVERGEEVGMVCARGGKDVVRKFATVRALLHDLEVAGAPERFPHLGELPGKEAPEERADADAGEVIATAAEPRATGAVVAVLGMVERVLHEAGERERAAEADFGADGFRQSVVAGLQGGTSNVQR